MDQRPVKGKLYSVEVILARDETPYLVEVNGCGTGLLTFEEVYGRSILEELLLHMRRLIGDKPIYSEYSDIAHVKIPPKEKKIFEKHYKSFIGYSATPWLTKRMELKSVPKDALQAVAKSLDIKYIPFTRCSVDDTSIEFTIDGKERRVSGRDIGLVWLEGQEDMFAKTAAFDTQLVNPYVIEGIIDNKMYTHSLLAETSLARHLPETVFIGAGLYHSIPQRLRRGKLVLKPNKGYQAMRVRVGAFHDWQAYIQRRLSRTAAAYVRRVVEKVEDYKMFDQILEPQAYLIQKYVESREFWSSHTDKKHPSVLRVLLFDGEYVGAIHQMCLPRLTLSYTNPEPVLPHEETIIVPFAKEVVRTLESRIAAMGIRTGQDFNDFRKRWWGQQLAG